MIGVRKKEGVVVDLFDLDGTVRPPPLKGEEPKPPPRELGTILRSMRKNGRLLSAASGMGMDGARVVEQQMRFRFDAVAVSYTCRLVWRGGRTPSELFLAPKDEHSALKFHAVAVLDQIAGRHDAHVDDKVGCYTMFLTPGSEAFFAARDEVEHMVAQHGGLLRFLANPDGGITVLPRSGGKHLIVEYLLRQEYEIGVAAGDTGSDEPLIRSAAFPIVTRTDANTPVNERLVQIVQERGVGFIAERPNADGLMDGLHAAKMAGFLNF